MSEFNSMKQGDIKVCPRCGGTVLSGYAKCPECGYAFMNVGANSSARLLDSRLNGVTDYEKRAHIISSFPIPNTREDLMEFLSVLEPKAFARHKGKEKERKEKKAYYEKYIECLNKAKISFGDDPATMMFIKHYNRDKFRLHVTEENMGVVIALVSFIIYFVILGGIALFESCSKKITKYQNESLKVEYEEWKAKANIEMEIYADSLQNLLDDLPTPTVSNYEECIRKLSKISWTKSWILPNQYDNRDIERDFHIRSYGLQDETKNIFEDKIKQYKYLIGAAWRENLKKKGYSEKQIENTIPREYR